MDASGGQALLGEVGGQEVSVPLGLHEDEGAVGADVAQDLHELVPFAELLHLEESLLHVGAGAADDADGQEQVVLEELWRKIQIVYSRTTYLILLNGLD